MCWVAGFLLMRLEQRVTVKQCYHITDQYQYFHVIVDFLNEKMFSAITRQTVRDKQRIYIIFDSSTKIKGKSEFVVKRR